MKQSFYVYNNGDLKRKDNTLQFTTYEGEKRANIRYLCDVRNVF